MTVRVLLVAKCLGIGGAERLVVNQVTNGDRTAIDYEVAYSLSAQNRLAHELRRLGVTVHDLGATSNYDLTWMRRLRSLLTKSEFDVVHFHMAYAASLGRLVVRSLPARRRPLTVYTEHSPWAELAAPIRLLNRVTIRSDEAVLAVSAATRQTMSPATRSRARVVTHGIDRDQARRWIGSGAEVRTELGVRSGEHLLVTVGNLRPQKAHEVLMTAVRLLLDRSVPVVVVAAGGGPRAEELRRRHRELRLGDRFRFLGPRDDAVRLIAGADVLALPSHYEAEPVVLMEALTVGTPIVATAVGGVPGMVVDGETGLLVPPACPEALANAVERLLDDPSLARRLADAGVRASEAYDARRAAATVEDLYHSLVPVA